MIALSQTRAFVQGSKDLCHNFKELIVWEDVFRILSVVPANIHVIQEYLVILSSILVVVQQQEVKTFV